MSKQKLNDFQPECSEDPKTGIKQIKINSKIEILKSRFYFHDVLKSSSGFSNHFIIEDLEVDPEDQEEDPDAQLFYYLKQTVYRNKAEYQNALSYYKKLYQYCQAKFAKNDIIRLHFIYNHEVEAEKYYELAVIFDFGEPDRIDIDHIESQHINKFLKNICILLNDIKNFDKLYHSNISIPNIVLVNNELKLSGFKPRYLNDQSNNSWKFELAKKYGHFRLDLFLIGLIWLRFLKFRQVDEVTESQGNLNIIKSLVNKITLEENEQHREIVIKLVRFEEHPNLSIDDVIIDFDEYFILQRLRSQEKQSQSNLPQNPLTSKTSKKEDQAIEFNFDSKDHQNYPSEQNEQNNVFHKSDSIDRNCFLKPYRESVTNLIRNGFDDSYQGGQKDRSFEGKEELLKIDDDFTLKDNNSVENFGQNQREDDLNLHEELITINDVRPSVPQRSPSAEIKREMDSKPSDQNLRSRINSEKKLDLLSNNQASERLDVMRKLRSQENLKLNKKAIAEVVEEEHIENLEEEFDKAIEREAAQMNQQNNDIKNAINGQPKYDPHKEMPKVPSKGLIPKQSTRSLKKFEEKYKYVDETADPNQLHIKALREKKHQLEEPKVHNLELPDDLKNKVQKEVEEDLEKLLENQLVKIKKGKEDVLLKEIERKEQDRILKEKIEKKLSENLEKKKKEQKDAMKKDKDVKEKDKKIGSTKNNKVVNPEMQNTLKVTKAEKDVSPNKPKIEAPTNFSNPVKVVNKPKDSIEELNKKFSKQFEISSHEQRKNTLGYGDVLAEPESKNLNFKKTLEEDKKVIEITSDAKPSQHSKPVENFTLQFLQTESEKFNTLSQSAHSKTRSSQFESKPNLELDSEHLSNSTLQNNLQNPQDIEKLKQQFMESMKKDPKSKMPTDNSSVGSKRVFDEFPSLEYSSQYSTPKIPNQTETNNPLPSFVSENNHNTLTTVDKPNITFGHLNSHYDTFSNYNTESVKGTPIENPQDTFNYKIMVTKRLFLLHRYGEALDYLQGLQNKHGIAQEIEILKLLSLIHFKMKNLSVAKETLIQALQLLRHHIEIEQAPELLKNILINIAIIEFESKNFEEVIVILRNKTFQEPGTISAGYYQLLGDSYYGLEDFKEAFIAYDLELQSLMNKDLDEKTLNEILSISCKIVMSLFQINESEIIRKFLQNMREIFTRAQKQETISKGQMSLESINWKFFMRMINLTEALESSDLTLIVLKEFINIGISEVGNLLSVAEKEKLLSIIGKTVNWLKGIEDLSARKTNLLGVILLGMELIQTMDSSDETNRQHLMLQFNKGLFFFEEEQFSMAKDSFDICLEIYYLNEDAPLEDLLLILFNIGVCLQKLENYDEASFYFEKVLENEVGETSVKEKTIKILAQIYYKIEIFNKCHDTLKKWIMENYQKIVKESFFKYLYMYYHCCKILHSDDLMEATNAVQWYISRNKDLKSSYFVHAYFNLTETAIDQGKYQEGEQYLQTVKAIFREDPNNGFQKEFVGDINIMYTKFAQGDYQEALNINTKLQKIMEDNPSQFEGSEDTLMNFLINFLFVIIGKLPIDEENIQAINERQILTEGIIKFKEDRKIFDKVYDLIKIQKNLMTSFISETSINNNTLEQVEFYESKPFKSSAYGTLEKSEKNSKSFQSIQSNDHRKEPSFNSKKKMESNINHKSELSAIYEQIKISEEPELEKQTKDHFSNGIKRARRVNSEEILKKSNLKKKTKCACFDFTRKNMELCKLIDDFIKQLKQIAMSTAISYIDTYFAKLEDGIKEKLLHWEKFVYIKKMIKFFQVKGKNKTLDRAKLFEFYDSIIESKDLCVHDLKNMLFLLEIFSESDMSYLNGFITFIDQEHKNLAKLVFNQLFLEAYNHRFDKLMVNLYKKITGNKFAHLEKFSLMHCLEFTPVLQLVPSDRASCFKHMLKPRYYQLNEPQNHSLFIKYMSPSDLFNFYIRREIQSSLLSLIKNESKNCDMIFNELFENLQNLFISYNGELLSNKFIFYELYSVLYFLDFTEGEKLAENVIQLFGMFEDKVPESVLYHYSIVASLIGNLFFKYKLFESSSKIKLIGFEKMKKIREVELLFPPYFNEIDPKSHMFGILSFMMMNKIEMEKLEPAKAFLDKINNINFDNPINNLEKKVLVAFFDFVTDNIKSAQSSIEVAQKVYDKMTWIDNQKDVFKAINDKIILNIAKKTMKPDQIGAELAAYESSISRIYKN